MQRIETLADVDRELAELLAVDPALKRLADSAAALSLRRQPGGFVGLAAIITAQQISSIAAAAIWARLTAAIDPFTSESFLATGDETLRVAGLSRTKISTLRGVATACADGFDFDALHRLSAEEAVANMMALKGVGRWTAEVYLLFCVGDADVFPAGDLALQIAAQHGLGLEKRPNEKALRALARTWSPRRGVAARLLWAYYAARRETAAATLRASRH